MSEGTKPEQHTWTVAQAAVVLGIGETLCYDLVAAGVVPSIRLGRVIRIPKARLLEWMDENTRSNDVAEVTQAAPPARNRRPSPAAGRPVGSDRKPAPRRIRPSAPALGIRQLAV